MSEYFNTTHREIMILTHVSRAGTEIRCTGVCAVLLIAGLRISALSQPPTDFISNSPLMRNSLKHQALLMANTNKAFSGVMCLVGHALQLINYRFLFVVVHLPRLLQRNLNFLQCRTYMSGNRNILKLHDRGVFHGLFPEERSPELLRQLLGSPQCAYCGFDPTADSLHVGNLLALVALLHCQRAGHNTIVILGGATAQIGDPSGRSTERSRIEVNTIDQNIDSIRESIHRIFNNHQELIWSKQKELSPPLILDNREWYASRNVVEFLSSVGRHFRMGQLLGRHSVQTRLSSPEGMSLTEFTYQIFQSYDWLYLFKKYNCSIQIGGNDQTGNIVAGHDLISRVTNKPVFGLTIPLVTSESGDKLGKTAGNAVWLNPDKTSPFDLYQFFIRQPDSEVERYLKLFSFLSNEEIDSLITDHEKKPESRQAQKKLAEEVTKLVHGADGLLWARRCTDVLYNNSVEPLLEMSENEVVKMFRNSSLIEVYFEPGTTIMDACMKAKCFDREVDAERVIKQGGVYLNQRRVQQPDYVLIPGEHILPNHCTLIRVGKKNYYIIKWIGF